MTYRDFSINTVNYPAGHWHAHVSKGGLWFTTMPSLRRLESEAWEDGKQLIDSLLSVKDGSWEQQAFGEMETQSTL